MEKNGRHGNVKAITEDEYYTIIGDEQYSHDTYHLVRTNMMGQKIAHALMESGVPFDDVNMGWDADQKALYSILLKIRNPNTLPQVFREPEIIALMNAYPAEMFSTTDKKIWKYLKQYSQPYPFSIIKTISRKDIFGELGLWKTIRSDDPLSEANPEYRKKGSRRSKILNALRRGLQLHVRLVRISTIHGAKGGEATKVFLHDAITRDIAHVLDVPYNRPLVEAEANIFFTGATRTLESLFIVNTHNKYRYGMPRLEVE
jgi:superfamily I DNA/RNA helicase